MFDKPTKCHSLKSKKGLPYNSAENITFPVSLAYNIACRKMFWVWH